MLFLTNDSEKAIGVCMVIVEVMTEEVLTFYHSWHNKVSALVCPGFESMPRYCITFYQSNNTFVFVISISLFVW